jgi:hypothetical protein
MTLPAPSESPVGRGDTPMTDAGIRRVQHWAGLSAVKPRSDESSFPFNGNGLASPGAPAAH